MPVLHYVDSSLHSWKKKPLKIVLFAVVKAVILSHSPELLLLCCRASPGAVYLSESQLLSSCSVREQQLTTDLNFYLRLLQPPS